MTWMLLAGGVIALLSVLLIGGFQGKNAKWFMALWSVLMLISLALILGGLASG